MPVASSTPNVTVALMASDLIPAAADDRLDGEDGADVVLPAAPGLRAPAGSIGPPPPMTAPVARHEPEPALSLSDYDDGWDELEAASVPALAGEEDEVDVGEEYPDIDWSGVLEDPYGRVPEHRSLDVPDSEVASTSGVLPPGPPTLELGPDLQRRIIESTVGSDAAVYAAVIADGPFLGRHGPGHKAYRRFHTGLSFGNAEFSQDSGTLGQLLRLMVDREPDTFAAVFGPAWQQLLAVTTAPGPSGELVEGGRGPRAQPVDGADLWEEPWLSRFRAAGAVPAFRAAQNQLAAELHLVPMLTVAAGFGLTTERALCMVVDRSITLGEQGAKRWVADTVGPARTHALRQAALAALGLDSIESFQASVPGLLVDGEFGPLTHATLTAALRALGAASPLPLPDVSQMVMAMTLRGQSEQGTARLVRLASDPELGDTPIGTVP